MNTKTPNTRKKFRRFKRQLQQQKAVEAVTPNKQVGKWADIREMFAKGQTKMKWHKPRFNSIKAMLISEPNRVINT